MKIGIDFGTSFSLPAIHHLNNNIVLLPSGRYGVPSVFYYNRDEGVLVGEDAEDAGQGTETKNMKREIKLELNSSFTADGRVFSAREIVGYILGYVVDMALDTAKSKLINEELEGVVISVPAAFEHNEKAFIKQAAEIPKSQGGPGLKVLDFIKEPVAAALSYFKTSLEDNTKILVYDLGGGTCDVAVVESKSYLNTKYRVLASDMLRVGGKDWDKRIAEYLTRELKVKYGLNINDNPDYVEKVRRAANSAKHSFSEKTGSKYRDKVRVRIELSGQLYTIMMTRCIFDEITIDLLNKTIDLTKKVLQNKECSNVTKMVCVGGSSNMPQVLEGITRAFPEMEISIFEPEKAIAMGAAIYAQMAQELPNSQKALTDIAAFSYGIRCYEDYDKDPERLVVINLIKKTEELPKSSTHFFSTIRDGQEHVHFNVFENIMLKDVCELEEVPSSPIMDVCLDLPPHTPKDTSIEVNMTLNSAGLIEITADDNRGHKCYASLQLYY